MSKPIIAIPSDIREMDGYQWSASPYQYTHAALTAAKVVPMIVPAYGSREDSEELMDAVLDRADGVLISGARSNVYPELYGTTAREEFGPYDHDRDSTSLLLIRRALERAIPLFAICRGIQELNVALGGTLAAEIQTREGIFDHRMPESDDNDARFALRHTVDVKPNGVLAGILGSHSFKVNSLHRQAIDTLAPGLEVEARTTDGTIEAVSVREARAFALGVQWHPEYWAESDGPSSLLFNAFGEAVHAHATRPRAVA